MVEEVSLRVGIDARPAAEAAASFKRSAADIIRRAENMERFVRKAADGFDTLKSSANGDSRILAGTGKSLRDVEREADRLARTAERVNKLKEVLQLTGEAAETERGQLQDRAISSDPDAESAKRSRSVLQDTIPTSPFGAILKLGDFIVNTVEDNKEAQERLRKFNEDIAVGKRLTREATALSGETADELSEEAAVRFENAKATEEKALALLRNKAGDQREFIGRTFGPAFGDNPLGAGSEPPTPALLIAQGHLRQLVEVIDRLETNISKRTDVIDSLRKKSPDAESRVESRPLPNPDNLTLPAKNDDDRVKKQIEDTTRSIELLKEQDRALADNATNATAQKEKELHLLLREKKCLERLNKALKDNAIATVASAGNCIAMEP